MEESAMDHAALSSSSTACDDHFASAIVKGKRTKRQRATAASSSYTASSVELSSTTTASATEEEEDMANCLILLAQGRSSAETAAPEKKTAAPAAPRASSASPAANAPGEFAYQCKTCDKCFPSFQALGGHRTSHKKPKTAVAALLPNAEKKTVANDENAAATAAAVNSSVPKPVPTAAASSGKTRMHECSICGSEFSSGQALGGHMRRHRPIPAAGGQPKEKNLFALDLNLPAPSDDDVTSPPPAATAFTFKSQPPPTPLVFPAAAWVDCHY